MSDTIIGIAVLQPTWLEGIYRLWFTALKGTGERAPGWIWCKDGRRTGLPDKMPEMDSGVNSIWRFMDRPGVRNPRTMDVCPSVNWISWGFHNGGQWSVEFVEMRTAYLPDQSEELNRSRMHCGSLVHYELNLPNNSDQWRRDYIAELEVKGALRTLPL